MPIQSDVQFNHIALSIDTAAICDGVNKLLNSRGQSQRKVVFKTHRNAIRIIEFMHIWVDADACPGSVKDILFRASKRCGISVTLVANQSIGVPVSELIDCIVVAHGADVADSRIVDDMKAGDLVVTADIPLAARVVEKGGQALDPRGELLTEANVAARLAMRDFMDNLRGSGIETGGPSSFSQKDVQAFANELDKILARRRQ